MKRRKTIHCYDIISNTISTRCGLLFLVTLLSLLLAGMPAQAATDYTFSPTGLLPVGCSLKSLKKASYTCGVVTLAVGDTITVGSPTPVTVTFTGAFTTAAGNLINTQGATSDLNFVTDGVVTLGADTFLNANVTGTAAINMGARSTISGNITTKHSTGVVTLGANSIVGGFIYTTAGAVNVASSGIVGGGITTKAGVVTLSTNIKVGGSITTSAGAITVGGGSSICGSVITTGAGVVTITTDVQIGGNIGTKAGAITVGSGSTVAGNIIVTGAGVVTSTNNLIGGYISTTAGAITLTNSRVGGSVAASGAGVVTLTNSTTNDLTLVVPVPPSCSVTPDPGLNHYRYEYDGSALTCATETVTIKACANADCSSLYASSTDLTFEASIPSSAPVSENLSFTGSTTIILAESTPTTVTMSMTSSSPSATLQCYENGALDPNCDYSLSDTGFIFLNETDNKQIIPTQLSGKPSDTGYNSKTIVLQAVQTDTNTGACTALFPDATETAVDLAYQCENPGTCSSNLASITNVNTNTGTTNLYDLSEYNTYGSHNLFFSSDSKAIISIKYPDAGQIKLYAKKSVTLLDGEVKLMTGNSNSFVVRPFGLSMTTADNNPLATDNSGGIFHRAGESFNMTMSAVQWVSGEDTDNNGVPDSGADISNNDPTPNFGQETTAVGVNVSHTLVSPLGGDASILTNNTFSGFSGGTKTQALSWDNVGIISLNAALSTGTYLGSDTITTAINNLGRFVPNHFRLKDSSINQTCGAFSYMGQTVNMSIDLEAQGTGDISLSNYNTATGIGADNHALASFGFVAENSDDGVNLGGRFGVLAADWVNGSVTVAFAPNFARTAAIDGPFDNVFVGLQVNDGEAGIAIGLFDNGVNGPDMNALSTGDCSVAGDCDALRLDAFGQVQPSEVSYRYGRLNSAQVFGPASQSLTLPLFTQTWNGSTFILSADDNCSTIDAANILMAGSQVTPFAANYDLFSLTDNSDVGDVQVDLTPANTTDTTLTAVSGEFNLTLGQSTGVVGYVPVTIKTLDAWLRFNWDEGVDGSADEHLPMKNATFGQFRGNDRVIYWREKK